MDLAENRFVNSYLENIGTLWSKSFRFSNSFYSKVGIYAHLAVRYEAKLRSQWADLAENRRVSSYSNPIDTLWSKSFRFSSSFHSKDGVYVHLGIALMSINQGWSDGVLALPTNPPSHLEAVPSLENFVSILGTTYGCTVCKQFSTRPLPHFDAKNPLYLPSGS